MSAELVHYAVSDAIGQITLDRAPVNALSMSLIDALLEALERARDDETARAVIICSAHKVFWTKPLRGSAAWQRRSHPIVLHF